MGIDVSRVTGFFCSRILKIEIFLIVSRVDDLFMKCVDLVCDDFFDKLGCLSPNVI